MRRFHVHVHIHLDDLDRSIAFYNAMFGAAGAWAPIAVKPRDGACC